MRVLICGGMSGVLLTALLSACSSAKVIEAHKIEEHEHFFQDSPFPALNQEMDKLIDPPPATSFGMADNMPNAPPGESINYCLAVLAIGDARVVGLVG